MNWLNLWNRLKGHQGSLEADLNEELAFHQSMKERDLEQTGVSVQDARAEARRSLGNITMAREQAREAWRFTWLTDLTAEFRYGARALFARPVCTSRHRRADSRSRSERTYRGTNKTISEIVKSTGLTSG